MLRGDIVDMIMDMLIELKQISDDMKKSGALPANVQRKIKKR